MPRMAPFSESDLRAAIAQALSWADALRFLGYYSKGSNYRTIQRWVAHWGISTAHFDPNAARRKEIKRRETPLIEAMVENSTYHRGKLKERLFAAGIKARVCELCGQGEVWRGHRMSLVLDHINGVSNDHRLDNLQIVCPNCAATLDTHCGRNLPRERTCAACGVAFEPRTIRHRYCSQACWGTVSSRMKRGVPQPQRRKVDRPSREQLIEDVQTMSVCAVGRKYGVTDNAVRKWLRWYEHEAERGGDAEAA